MLHFRHNTAWFILLFCVCAKSCYPIFIFQQQKFTQPFYCQQFGLPHLFTSVPATPATSNERSFISPLALFTRGEKNGVPIDKFKDKDIEVQRFAGRSINEF